MTDPTYFRPGTADQWERVRAAKNSDDMRTQRRAESAERNARLCGTDPSWYGF